MIHRLFKTTAPLVGVLSMAGIAAAQDITAAERERALNYLNETRSEVVGAVEGLSEAQWNFKPGPDRWSIHEVLEHIAIAEECMTTGIRPRLEKAPAAADRNPQQIDAMVLSKVPDRSMKVQAPPQLTPAGRWTGPETLQHFLAGRRQTIQWLNSDTDLRGHAVNHLVFGPLDGYEWILAAAAHSERHTKQILEVKADPNFPTR